MKYSCPICTENLALSTNTKQVFCTNNHQFDRAKQGYFNLLPVQRKNSKEPGDSKEMITARQDFLNANHYLPLAKEINSLLSEMLDANSTLLDLGCGEGYYSRQLLATIPTLELYGIDISKAAIIKAAAQDKIGNYSVASSDNIPLQQNSVNCIVKIYAPANEAELRRVLTNDGLLLTVTPAPRHLWQLREFIYDDVREHDTQDTTFEGFRMTSSNRFSYQICPSNIHRMALLQMTPFAWKANQAQTKAISEADGLDIELDFIINLYQPT